MKQRTDAVERWATYVKRSNGAWKKVHTEFIDAQFHKAEVVMKRMLKQENGAEKIIKLYGIKNKEGYAKLLFGNK